LQVRRIGSTGARRQPERSHHAAIGRILAECEDRRRTADRPSSPLTVPVRRRSMTSCSGRSDALQPSPVAKSRWMTIMKVSARANGLPGRRAVDRLSSPVPAMAA
jgi:hypothetical protein